MAVGVVYQAIFNIGHGSISLFFDHTLKQGKALGIDEARQILAELCRRFRMEVHHVPRLVIRNGKVLPLRWRYISR